MSNAVAVLLRDGTHSGATNRYALLCDNFVISIAKSPIQIPIPLASPEIIDLGYARPNISLSGLVPTVGDDPSNTSSTPAITQGMSSVSVTTYDNASSPSTTSAQTYYFPYKNALEDAGTAWIYDLDTPLEIEIVDSTTPISTGGTVATGGGVYKVALQQMRFQVDAAKEDRWSFQIQMISTTRLV